MKKLFAVIALAGICLHLAYAAGVDVFAADWLKDIASDGRLVAASLNIELGAQAQREPDSAEAPESATESPDDSSAVPAATGGFYLPYSSSSKTQNDPEPDESPEILPTTIYGGMTISNATGFDIDISELMAYGLSQTLPSEGPQILIVHTHGSEAYTPDGNDTYDPSDASRTEDTDYNVVRVGDELTAALESHGLKVLHDRSIYDYPSYTGSYIRSLSAVEAYLEQYPDIAVVFDIHRDALGSDGVVYKTMAEVPGESSAQIMLLVGTGEKGLYHPNWQENLKLALYLQNAVSQNYPTLMRPVALKQERYNQHATTGSLILEVGSSGNTLREAVTAIKLFADAIAPALLELCDINSV